MTLFSLPLSSSSRCFPKSSVPFLRLRPPPAPPPEPPSPPAPPKPPDPPDPHICASSREARAQPLSFHHLTSLHRVHIDSKPPSPPPSRSVSPPPSRSVSPCRKSIPMSIAALARRFSRCRHLHHLLCSSKVNLGFYYLGQIWMGGLLGQKWRAFLLGPINPTPNPLFSIYRDLSCLISFTRHQPSHAHPVTPSLLLRFAGKVASSFSIPVTIPPILFLQVCSYYSFSDSSTVGSYWMDVESVDLALWNSGLVIALSMIVDSRGSTFVLSRGTFIALVRPFTAICSPFTAICSPFTAICSLYFGLTLSGVALLQIGQRFLSSFTVPVILVRRGFHSPHLSFTELIILPKTSLVFSVIVIGRLVIKTVLLEAEARIVLQDGSRSAFADGLTSEALFPPPCGFGKDYRSEDVCSSALVAEALALRNIVEQLAEHSARFTTGSIEVFSDSQGLISSIKTKASSKELKAILHDITYVSDSLKSLSFHFVPRLRNVVVDSIAKSALVAANSSSFNGV